MRLCISLPTDSPKSLAERVLAAEGALLIEVLGPARGMLLARTMAAKLAVGVPA